MPPFSSHNTRASKRHHNRQAILHAARAVFAERGFGGTTVRDIIRRTDLATGTFYNYFDSKDEVFAALNETIGGGLREKLSHARTSALDFQSFVENNYRVYFGYFATHRENYFLMRSNRGREGGNQVMQGPQVQAGVAEMSADIRQAIAAGVLPAMDADYLAASLAGIAFGVLDIMMERDPIAPEAATLFATHLAIYGIGGLSQMRKDKGED